MDGYQAVVYICLVILVIYLLIYYKPMKVEVTEYMISNLKHKKYYKWIEIKSIEEVISNGKYSFHLNMSKGFERNIKYVVTPKKGKIFIFSLSQIITSHPTLQITSVSELIKRKKEELGI